MAKQKLRKYELIYLVQPEATDEEREKITDRVNAVIEQHGGHVLEREDWGKRKLAYEIRKQNKAYYTYLVLLGPTGMTREIERVLRLLDNCIRFLTVKLDESRDGEELEGEGEAAVATTAEGAESEEETHG